MQLYLYGWLLSKQPSSGSHYTVNCPKQVFLPRVTHHKMYHLPHNKCQHDIRSSHLETSLQNHGCGFGYHILNLLIYNCVFETLQLSAMGAECFIAFCVFQLCFKNSSTSVLNFHYIHIKLNLLVSQELCAGFES